MGCSGPEPQARDIGDNTFTTDKLRDTLSLNLGIAYLFAAGWTLL